MPDQTNLWGYDYGASAWVKVAVDSAGRVIVDNRHNDITQVRVTATGLVYTGLAYIHWMNIVPSAKANVVDLTDAVGGGGTPIWEAVRETLDSTQITFTPPLKFSTGIYVETFTNMTAINMSYKTG
jgi:hypothetical protein